MSNSTNEARQLAAVFKNAAKDGVLEKPFRESVEAHLIQVARSAGIDLVPHTEVTMGSSGRADTIYNRFIVEWKQPGLFSPSNNATANSTAIAQLKGYVETFWFSNRQKPGRVVGCCTDDRVTGNCSTTLLGRTNASEMAERSYRFLNPDIKAAATRLDKGQLILSHAVFREPVKIKFPMAAYKQPS